MNTSTMKSIVGVFLLAVVAISLGNKPHYDLDDAPALFEKFIKDHNRNYKDDADREAHYQAFVQSLEAINNANAKPSPTTYDINNFADYTEEEQSNMRGLLVPGDKPQYDLDDAPALFEKFIKDYNRNYKDDADREAHYQAFVQSLEAINIANAKPSPTSYDINNFADYTEEEQSNMRGLLVPGDKPHYDLDEAPALFEKFIKDYNRNYKDDADREAHYQAFVQTLEAINNANAKPSPTTYDINKFADYTVEEQSNMRGSLIPEDKPYYDLNDAPCLFENFISDYNRNYKNEEDRQVHYQAFVKSLNEINRLNSEPSGTTYDINNLADYTDKEQNTLAGLILNGEAL